MSEARAIEEARDLKRIMAKHGVECVVELRRGRPNVDGSDWWTRKHVSMNHHTAGPAKGLTPTYSLVRNGRSDLPGPLANGYGGRDHVYRIITMGLANHPGEGGPLTVAGFYIPRDSARISTWGTEWEHTGVDPWPRAMKDFMARSNAALLEWMDRPVRASIEHKTWAPDRKIDRNAYTAEKGQDEVSAYLDTIAPPAPPVPIGDVTQEEDGMILIVSPGGSAYHLTSRGMIWLPSEVRDTLTGSYASVHTTDVEWEKYKQAFPIIQG